MWKQGDITKWSNTKSCSILRTLKKGTDLGIESSEELGKAISKMKYHENKLRSGKNKSFPAMPLPIRGNGPMNQ